MRMIDGSMSPAICDQLHLRGRSCKRGIEDGRPVEGDRDSSPGAGERVFCSDREREDKEGMKERLLKVTESDYPGRDTIDACVEII